MADWRNRLSQIVNKIKHQLNSKGVDNIEQLQQTLIEFDANKNGSLEKLEFNNFLNKLGVFLTTQELRTVYDHFDANRNGLVSYAELIAALRSNIADSRLHVVADAFHHVSEGASSVSIDKLASSYNAAAHPRVASREKTADSVFAEFIDGISKYAVSGSVTEVAFVQYYMDFNCVLPVEKELYFVQTVKLTWGLHTNTSVVPLAKLDKLIDILYEKIRQRTHGADDEGKTVQRFFKHFDLFGNGSLSPKEFRQALEALGCVFAEPELDAVFDRYDAAKSGRFDYLEFAGHMALRGTGNNPNVNPIFSRARDPPTQALEKIRAELKRKGIYGIRQLILLFKHFDKNADARLNRQELQWIFKQNGQNLNPSEFERVFKYFDVNGDDFVNSSEFIKGIRGELSPARLAFVAAAWKKIAPTGDISNTDFVAAYDITKAPGYGFQSQDQIVEEFLDQIDQNHDGRISENEWVDFYTNISPSFASDEAFANFLHASWRLY